MASTSISAVSAATTDVLSFFSNRIQPVFLVLSLTWSIWSWRYPASASWRALTPCPPSPTPTLLHCHTALSPFFDSPHQVHSSTAEHHGAFTRIACLPGSFRIHGSLSAWRVLKHGSMSSVRRAHACIRTLNAYGPGEANAWTGSTHGERYCFQQTYLHRHEDTGVMGLPNVTGSGQRLHPAAAVDAAAFPLMDFDSLLAPCQPMGCSHGYDEVDDERFIAVSKARSNETQPPRDKHRRHGVPLQELLGAPRSDIYLNPTAPVYVTNGMAGVQKSGTWKLDTFGAQGVWLNS